MRTEPRACVEYGRPARLGLLDAGNRHTRAGGPRISCRCQNHANRRIPLRGQGDAGQIAACSGREKLCEIAVQAVQQGLGFRIAQTISAAAMALGHGLQDAQKTMGVIFLALVTGGFLSADDDLPFWVIAAAATAISLGTMSGGWRIMRTLGRRIIHLDPSRGFAAESVAASVLYTTAYVWEAPISTTHTITSSIMGVGATKRFSAVRWGVAKSIVAAWIFTFPAAGTVAALTYLLCHFVFQLP